jgi:predicted ABC-type ATPase
MLNSTLLLLALLLTSCSPTGTGSDGKTGQPPIDDPKKCSPLALDTCQTNPSCFWDGTLCESKINASQCSDLDGHQAQCNAFKTKKCIAKPSGKCTEDTTTPTPPTPTPPANCGAAGSGKWDFGTRGVGSLNDESAPFIIGHPTGSCSFMPNEQNIIADKIFNKSTGTGAQKIAIFTMGAPGCGKSSSLDVVIQGLGFTRANFVNVDPDAARARIRAFKDATKIPSTLCPGKMRSYADAVSWCLNNGRDIRDRLLTNVINQNKSYILDTPCLDTNYCKLQMQSAKTAGFTVYLVAVWAQSQTCTDRAMDRAYETGRYTRAVFITQAYDQINTDKEFKNLAALADKSFVFDNDGLAPQKVFESGVLACTPTYPACIYYAP